MSKDIHDKYCGSFGQFSDCPQCRKLTQEVAPVKPKKKFRLGASQPATGGDWAADIAKEAERLMQEHFEKEPHNATHRHPETLG